MRHRNRLNKLSLKSSHRKAMIRNMLTSLFKHESITTTKAKAKVLQKAAEKMITRAKVDSVHNRREINKSIYDKDVLNKLFTKIGPMFAERQGGYTRVLKLGFRQGDAAEMALIELVEKTADQEKAEKTAKKPAAKKAPAKKPAAKKAAPKTEAKAEEPKVEEAKAEEKAEATDKDSE